VLTKGEAAKKQSEPAAVLFFLDEWQRAVRRPLRADGITSRNFLRLTKQTGLNKETQPQSAMTTF
jgi:hypothetical protein